MKYQITCMVCGSPCGFVRNLADVARDYRCTAHKKELSLATRLAKAALEDDIEQRRMIENLKSVIRASAGAGCEISKTYFATFEDEHDAAWIPVESMPPAGRRVLINAIDSTYTGQQAKTRVLVAYWMAAKTEEYAGDFGFGEYDEEADAYYCPEGWYESAWNCEDYSGWHLGHGYQITHWQELPEVMA